MNGREKLRHWMLLNKLSYVAFGKEIGATGTSVYRWCAGYHTPRWAILRRIHNKTGGYVRPDDWLIQDKADHEPAV